jgi:Cof subfamily protein (haloacid dehalogenase superfamily)
MNTPAPWLIALDVDGTILREDGSISPIVHTTIQSVAAAGHHVMLATGRSVATTLPVLDRLGLTSTFIVCANGAITLRRDPAMPLGYRREWIELFDPTDVLLTLRTHLTKAHFAVEDEHGHYRHTAPFPETTIGGDSEQVDFDTLLHRQATRLVVMSPGHDMDDFLAIVERMGLQRVSYAIGWTAWLDISADGVTKASAMERVRTELNVPANRVMAVADGRNDIELLSWAAANGRGVAMGHAPVEVRAAGNEVTASVTRDGVAESLATLLINNH